MRLPDGSQPKRAQWHGLMISTGFMFIVLGIPGTCLAMIAETCLGTLTASEAVLATCYMAGFELVIGGTLFTTGWYLSRRR